MVAATLLEREYLTPDPSPTRRGELEIHLFEKNSRLWAKVIISGGGRCNVTTGFFKMQELLPKYPRGATFLKPALEQFWPRAIRRRFETHGVPLKQEEDGRIFPVSDDGKDIVAVFEQLFGQRGVQMHLKERVQTIARSAQWFQITTDKHAYTFDAVVVTTGGNAYAHTGSTGDGYAWARGLGHTITPLGPSLNSFLTNDQWLHACSGISFPDAQLTAEKNSSVRVRWAVLLTHFGLSGPAVFAFSSHIPYEQVTKEQPYSIFFQPEASRGVPERTEQLTQRAIATPKKELGNLLRQWSVRKFVETILVQYGFDPHMHIGNISKQQRAQLATLLGKGIPLTLIQRRPGDEFVTAGGVSLEEVDPASWHSRLVPWLYFAGEILDVDGYTGGYNLTSSRAMGRLVGKSIGL